MKLKTNETLEWLDLERNRIGDAGVEELNNVILKRNQTLKI